MFSSRQHQLVCCSLLNAIHAYNMVFENCLLNFIEGHITYCAELRIIFKYWPYPIWQGNPLYGNNFALPVQAPYLEM